MPPSGSFSTPYSICTVFWPGSCSRCVFSGPGMLLQVLAFGSMGRASRFWRHASLVALVAALGCNDRRARPSGAKATAPSVPSSVPSASLPTPRAFAAFVVDELGISIQKQRIDLSADLTRGQLRDLVGDAAPGQSARIDTARAARFADVSALVLGLGRIGVEEVDVVTSIASGGHAQATLKLQPRDLVPMHEDRCGALVTINADNTGSFSYLKKRKPITLPQGQHGPDVSTVLDGMRGRMKGCGSTLWMLEGKADSKWGAAFDLGLAASSTEVVPGAHRYITLL
jgi:hypothetical protein